MRVQIQLKQMMHGGRTYEGDKQPDERNTQSDSTTKRAIGFFCGFFSGL
jgi:hypothetical protein